MSSKVNTKAKIPGTIRDNIPRDPVKENVNNIHMLIDNTPGAIRENIHREPVRLKTCMIAMSMNSAHVNGT